MTSGPPPVCVVCQHFDAERQDAMVCRAFPEGIPERIILAGSTHQVVGEFPQVGEFVFTPIPGTEDFARERVAMIQADMEA